MFDRDPKDVPTGENPVALARHTIHGTDGSCLGVRVRLWCPGCQRLHWPTFRCPEHGGPPTGPTWDGDPNSDPFTMSPSYLVHPGEVSPLCHSFIKAGQWEFLGDCTHELAGQTVPLEPLPDWLCRDA